MTRKSKSKNTNQEQPDPAIAEFNNQPQSKHIGAKPLPSGDSAPPEHFTSEPGIHTRYDVYGGHSDRSIKIIEFSRTEENSSPRLPLTIFQTPAEWESHNQLINTPFEKFFEPEFFQKIAREIRDFASDVEHLTYDSWWAIDKAKELTIWKLAAKFLDLLLKSESEPEMVIESLNEQQKHVHHLTTQATHVLLQFIHTKKRCSKTELDSLQYIASKFDEIAKTLSASTIKTTEKKQAEARGGEAQKNSGQMKAESWKELSLDVIDDNTIRYKIGKVKWQRINYAELGFQDKRKGLPNKLWGIFKELSQHCKSGVIEYYTPKGINISKDIDRICKILKEFFGPKDRPICYNKSNKAWKVAFKLTYKFQGS